MGDSKKREAVVTCGVCGHSEEDFDSEGEWSEYYWEGVERNEWEKIHLGFVGGYGDPLDIEVFSDKQTPEVYEFETPLKTRGLCSICAFRGMLRSTIGQLLMLVHERLFKEYGVKDDDVSEACDALVNLLIWRGNPEARDWDMAQSILGCRGADIVKGDFNRQYPAVPYKLEDMEDQCPNCLVEVPMLAARCWRCGKDLGHD